MNTNCGVHYIFMICQMNRNMQKNEKKKTEPFFLSLAYIRTINRMTLITLWHISSSSQSHSCGIQHKSTIVDKKKQSLR